MANTIDPTKSATQCAQDINENFDNMLSLDSLHSQSGTYSVDKTAGENIDLPTYPSHLLTDVNTIRLIKDVQDNAVNISGQYGHEPNMLIHDGYIYLAYMYQATGTGEGQAAGLSKVRLAKVSIETMAVVGEQLIIAEQDNTFTYTDGGSSVTKTIWSAGSPNVALVSGKIRIMFTAWLTDTNNAAVGYGNHESVICYRDYTISDGSLSNITICTFTKDGTTYPLTLTNFRAWVEGYGNVLQVHCQYAKFNANGKYYISIGNGTSGRNGNIFTTEDFATYDYWSSISIPQVGQTLGLQFEIAIFPFMNYGFSSDGVSYGPNCLLYCAMRRQSENTMLLVALTTGYTYTNGSYVKNNKLTEGSVDSWRTIPCASSRPCFFTTADAVMENMRTIEDLFLMYDAAGQVMAQRNYTSVAKMRKHTFANPTIGVIAQALRMTYPSIVYHDGEYYVSYQAYIKTDNQPKVMLSKFRPQKLSLDDVIPTLAKMFDTFGPANG